MECPVDFCEWHDFGSENSCWLGEYTVCEKRLVAGEGVLFIKDEHEFE